MARAASPAAKVPPVARASMRTRARESAQMVRLRCMARPAIQGSSGKNSLTNRVRAGSKTSRSSCRIRYCRSLSAKTTVVVPPCGQPRSCALVMSTPLRATHDVQGPGENLLCDVSRNRQAALGRASRSAEANARGGHQVGRPTGEEHGARHS